MLRERIAAALKDALKARDERRVSTLRLILAALQDRDIAKRGADGDESQTTDEEVHEMLAKMIRQREEAIRLYEQAGRVELAEEEAEEIAIIREFLPRQLDEAETAAAVDATIGDVDANCAKDIGRTMAALKRAYAGQMDFAKASAMVKRRLC